MGNGIRTAKKLHVRLVKLMCILLMTLCFAICCLLYRENRVSARIFLGETWISLCLYTMMFTYLASLYEAFSLSISRISELIYSLAVTIIVCGIISYVIMSLVERQMLSIWPLFVMLLLQGLIAVVWARSAHRWYFASHPPKKTVIIWGSREGIDELITSYGLEKRYQVTKTIHVRDCLAALSTELQGAEAVFLSGVKNRDRNTIIKYCISKDIDSYMIPRVGDVIMSGASSLHLFHLSMLKLERCSASVEYFLAKRVFDVVVAVLALIITSPILLVTAILIKGTDGGTVFYRQTRLTKDGKEFEILKFRSMRMDSKMDGIARLSAGSQDDRVTKVGRVIRAVRIDELPQLINVLKGEMSIVGPRPERPEIAKVYEQEVPEFALRLQVKAGLTGYAQVYGKYNTQPYDKLLMDLSYIANLNMVEDIKICLATIKILFMPESTEGIAAGQTTASRLKQGSSDS